MGSTNTPDFTTGFAIEDLKNGEMIQGRVGDEDVILARHADEFFAVGAGCTHYHAPLAEGLLVGDELRCPLHHACFSLRTGMPLRAPAFDAIPRWRVERVGDRVFVRERLPVLAQYPEANTNTPPNSPSSVVIVGGGAAGLAAADMLRRRGYDGPTMIISADDSAPYDRPNVSKDYLQEPIPDEWMNLRVPDFYRERRIDLVLNSRVSSLDLRQKRVQLEDGRTYPFGALLLATGADVIRLPIPGAHESDLYYVRTWSDARAIFKRVETARQVVVVGASFIGLEVAASLRSRGLGLHVVAPENQPFERTLGAEVGGFFRALHESHGVIFHLGRTVASMEGHQVTLSDGTHLQADFLILGVGVHPSVTLAEQAGLQVDRGIVVNEYLETTAPGVFAAGDTARWPDPHSRQQIRVEHWVLAERQGQVAARNILGYREPFDAVPFFWTQQFGVALKYVGHAEKWDAIEIDGSLDAKNCAVSYKQGGKTAAIATIGREIQSLQNEIAMEALRPKIGLAQLAAKRTP
jgi:NADPH-dependent 2,4-dienoyl-CoA reductase/sulfur reductase-like enzyme/nitrite reductase/ring-hydroxylating ferredoxin subunit